MPHQKPVDLQNPALMDWLTSKGVFPTLLDKFNMAPNSDKHTHVNSAAPGNFYGLDPIISPRSIVLVSAVAGDNSVSDAVWKNLTSTFGNGPLRRVEFKSNEELSQQLPPRYDQAIIVAPRSHQEQIIVACDQQNIRTALVISPDYREPGIHAVPPALVNISSRCKNGLRVLGPQSFGIINPRHDYNCTPLLPMPRAGNIALISQSGALCASILDWSFRTGVGFSAIVSCGQMVDIDWNDLITYFGDDPYTKSIVLYLETIDDARSFLSAAREVALSKPIIALKAGRTPAAAAIAASHSHGDGRSDALLNAALQRVGVLRVSTVAELFYMANILSSQPLPRGPRLTIITNAIGPAIMATDTLLTSGGQLAQISPEVADELTKCLPATTCCDNPIDVLGDAGPQVFGNAIKLSGGETTTDGLLVILTPQTLTQPTATARELVSATAGLHKPVLASWMGGDRVAEGQNVLFEAGIPAFPYPDTPARLFALMWRQAQNLNSIYETPSVIINEDTPNDPGSVAIMLEGARAQTKTELTDWEAKAVLRAYGLPVIETVPAATEDEAVTAAGIFGFPVIVKLLSTSSTMKQSIHGIRVTLRTDHDVREAFRSIRADAEAAGKLDHFQGVTVQRMISTKGEELIVGCRFDSSFGPYLYIGTGGRMTEIINDRALGLPPLTTALAQRMIEQTRIWEALRGPTAEQQKRLNELQSLLVRLSQLVTQHPAIAEIEINPLLATSDSIIALAARMTLHPSTIHPADLPRTAIRPYPSHYTWVERLRDDTKLTIRPVRPEDEPLIVEFHKILSEETIYRRYFFQHKFTRRTSHERLRRTCFLDFDREIALAALIEDSATGRLIAAVGRLSRNRSGETAEIALVVADPFQGQGIGTSILRRLIDIARQEGIAHLEGTMLPGNIHMQHLFGKLGFAIVPGSDDTVVASLQL